MIIRHVSALVFTLFAGGVAIYLTHLFRRWASEGRRLPQIRKIAGIDAIDQAVGRCVEMGRPVMFSLGSTPNLLGTDQTAAAIAGTAVLGYVAGMCADYNIPLIVPICSPDILPMVDETIKQAYIARGKAENFDRESTIRYLSQDAWAWSSATMGIQMSEKPGAYILVGPAGGIEAVANAETGVRIGSIQIGGSTRPNTLGPIAVMMDYVLIGEEIYAASAYVSKDPTAISALVGQDATKMIGAALVVIGVILLNVLGSPIILNILKT